MSLMLTALRGDIPVGFLAGLGLVRICPRGTALSWDPSSRRALLHGIDRHVLLEHLVAHMKDRSASAELAVADDVRGLALARYREIAASCDLATLEWVRAWWREDGDVIAHLNICFTSGQMRMIKMARELAASLDPARGKRGAERIAAKFDEALFGPWRYEDKVSSWGWDPATYRIGAETPMAPTEMKTDGVAAAYWLAWEALPFLPNIPGQGTLGFVKDSRGSRWTWSTWGVPLDRHAIAAALHRPDECVALGGDAYESAIVKSGYYGFFRQGRVQGRTSSK